VTSGNANHAKLWKSAHPRQSALRRVALRAACLTRGVIAVFSADLLPRVHGHWAVYYVLYQGLVYALRIL
jgi:hypothetical protein